MNSSWRIALVAGALSTVAGPAAGKTARKIALKQTLCVHLYNEAQVSGGTLHWATAEATRIFRWAGINIIWQQPQAELPQDQGLDMSSANRSADEREYLVVRITQRTPAAVVPNALALPLISNVTAVSSWAALKSASDWRPQITVQVYNAADVTPFLVLKAEHEADWIFGKAGIRVNWMSCHFDPKSTKPQGCSETDDPLLFVLRINPGHASAVVSVEALGFALPFTDKARHGAVNYQNVEAVYQKNRDLVDVHRLMANVMVHELTHLILESTRHGEGLMHANWSRADLKRMGKRQLALTPEQVRQIRAALKQRASRTREHSLASSSIKIAHAA